MIKNGSLSLPATHYVLHTHKHTHAYTYMYICIYVHILLLINISSFEESAEIANFLHRDVRVAVEGLEAIFPHLPPLLLLLLLLLLL